MRSSKPYSRDRSGSKQQVIGVISDTHGLLRPSVFEAFKGVELILHAGDIGNSEVLDGLQTIAPVVAVRGNNDNGAWASRIPEMEIVRVAAISIYMLHDVKQLEPQSLPSDVRAVVSGHSHQPRVESRNGVLFLNPGSAGPRRFKLPICVARLTIRGSDTDAELIQLSDEKKR